MSSRIEYEYREWLIDLAVEICSDHGSYRELFEYLYSREFYSDVGNDDNRIADGIDLRFRFTESSHRYNYRDVYNYLYDAPCNVLEMMVALACRCEDHIMGDADIGDRTGVWLFTMLKSLHLSDEVDGYFNEDNAKIAIDRLLSHSYKRNGDGGLFTLKSRTREDMRKTEIWYQMCWYLDEFMDS